MTPFAVRVAGLSKLYQIGGPRARYKTLREAIVGLARPWGGGGPERVDTIWALRDVSFEVEQGEVIGIIGRNGAGKSTLLKILSRITEPTEGQVEVRGRVGSLLEVGTGFHPELTGRENILLNGAVLGMKRAETLRKLDEIVAFAEVEKFLDTPVKHYSSGMYMRLAFSVAAHLEPDILIVDEVIAVGDLEFQKRCLGKMGEVAQGGRTVLLVSHNMAAVGNLCRKALLLEGGRRVIFDAVDSVIGRYLGEMNTRGPTSLRDIRSRTGDQSFVVSEFWLTDGSGNLILSAVSGQDIGFAFRYESRSGRPVRNVHVSVGITGAFGEPLFYLGTDVAGGDFRELPREGTLRCAVSRLPLLPGTYGLTIFCMVGREITDWVTDAARFEVEAGDFFGLGKLPPMKCGAVMVPHRWEVAESLPAAVGKGN